MTGLLLIGNSSAVLGQPPSIVYPGDPSSIEDAARQSTVAAASRWAVPADFIHEESVAIAPAWTRRLTGYISTGDGTKLRYSVLLPAGKGPFPLIVNYSGYDPGAMGGAAYLHDNTAMSTSLDRSLLQHGYALLGVNARGTGCSEGTFDFLGPAYGRDGADVVEWAARQTWSTGSVGMANWSWAGMSQIATAIQRPPHLKAIAPGMALTDPRADSWAIGGVSSEGFVTGWWMFLHSRWLAVRESAEAEHDQRCLEQVEQNFATGQTAAVNLPSQMIRHPLRDEWIAQRTILDRADRIEVPVLSMEAFQDEATTARAGYYQERLDPARLWYVQTNGDHDLYESLRFRRVLIDFLDHFVKGRSNGFETRAHVEVWQETTSTPGAVSHVKNEQAEPGWVIRRQQYPVPVTSLILNLGDHHALKTDPSSTPGAATAGAASAGAASAGAVTAGAATAGAVTAGTSGTAGTVEIQSDTYEYPIPGPAVDVDPDAPAWGPLSTRWGQGSVAYSTPPLSRDVVIYGAASADLWISSTLSDTDIQVTLTEVRPDGQERYVQRGWLRMSDRALDPMRSTPTRPCLCDRPACIQALIPGVPTLGRVELTKVSHAFRTGSRIRIWIDTPSATGENSFDHSSLRGINTIWHDPAHPSRVVFGTLPELKVPGRSAPCGRVLMQPCRRDPLRSSMPPDVNRE